MKREWDQRQDYGKRRRVGPIVALLLFGLSLECSFTLARSQVIPIGAVNTTSSSGRVFLTSFHVFNHGPRKTTVQFHLFNNAGTDITGEIYDSPDPSREIESNQSWVIDVPRGPMNLDRSGISGFSSPIPTRL